MENLAENQERATLPNQTNPLKRFLSHPQLSILAVLVLLSGLFLTINAAQENQDKRSRAAEITPTATAPDIGLLATALVKKSADTIVASDPVATLEKTMTTEQKPFSSIPYSCSALFQAAKKFETTDPVRTQKYRAYGTKIADFLVKYKDMDKDGKVGWGLGYAWDAFGDKTTNPVHTEYAFQTPMAVYCLADAYEVTNKTDYLLAASWGINYFGSYGTATVDPLCKNCYYYWYSHSPYDKGRYVKNTNVLMGLAIARWAKIRSNSVYTSRANQIFNAEKYEIDIRKNFAYLGRNDPKYTLRRDSHIWTEIWFMKDASRILGRTDYKATLLALKNDFWKCGTTCQASTTSSYGIFSACIIASEDLDSKNKCGQAIKSSSTLSNFPLLGVINALDALKAK